MEQELKPRIGFQDFLEMTGADDRNFQRIIVDRMAGATRIPSLPRTHIFHLGDNENIVEAILPIRNDIAADCKDRVPMPFSDTSCISTVVEKGQKYWLLDRIFEDPSFREDLPLQPIFEKGWTLKQKLFLMRYTEHNREIFGKAAIPMMWDVSYCGNDAGKYLCLCSMDVKFAEIVKSTIGGFAETFFNLAMKETSAILEQLAAISHPQNYLVRVTPELTPREKRHMDLGEPRPIRKSPHFIVVDHDVLVGMSQGHYGTHASPVPHERRGHWRRLAERCLRARALGKERVFVRPTYVGERQFSDEKNQYEVLMDFAMKEAT